MTYTLRNADLGDLASITAIYADAVENGTASYELLPPGEEEMRTRFRALAAQAYPYIVAQDETGLLAGYAYASAFRTRPAYRWIVEDSIYIAEDQRGRGLGHTLLEELVARCTALGFRQMIAVIGGASPASVALHRKAGFTDIGLMKGSGYKHGRWLDTMLMQRALGEGTTSDPDLDAYPGTLFSP